MGNESDTDVFFDDVRVRHGQVLQVQETEYDPTGLELAGLSRPTPGLKRLNQYKFNGQELQTDLGLNWNHQGARFIDLARGPVWLSVDPDAEQGSQESWSTYHFGFGNAVRYNDPDGRCPTCPQGETADEIYALGATIASEGKTWVYTGQGVYAETVSSKMYSGTVDAVSATTNALDNFVNETEFTGKIGLSATEVV